MHFRGGLLVRGGVCLVPGGFLPGPERGVCLVRGVSAWSGGCLPGPGGVCLVRGGCLPGLGGLPGPGGVLPVQGEGGSPCPETPP